MRFDLERVKVSERLSSDTKKKADTKNDYGPDVDFIMTHSFSQLQEMTRSRKDDELWQNLTNSILMNE